MADQEYYTIPEAAEKLRCTPAAIRKWIAQKKIEVVYVGSDRRITSAALDAFVKSSTDLRKSRQLDGGDTIDTQIDRLATQEPVKQLAA